MLSYYLLAMCGILIYVAWGRISLFRLCWDNFLGIIMIIMGVLGLEQVYGKLPLGSLGGLVALAGQAVSSFLLLHCRCGLHLFHLLCIMLYYLAGV